jgi:hypothetical protein
MRLILLVGIALLAAPAAAAASAAADSCAKTRYGTGITLAESTPVATLLDHADEHVGRAVRIEGVVADVCAAAGCWLEIRAGEGERTLRVKVKDGEIVFPTSARGHQATAEGTFEARELDRAAYVRWAKHLAEEQGRPFDEAAIVGEGPFHLYQVAGRGAEICQ